ncbi:DUF2254 domain-containing protein [Marinobacterium jannaschii]|uniref:DUF2254 domain-containing protein n=1 Tax=Marinobacterium jannaschii TaxID=64970 RepID=UPI00068557DD|nr:DUF2254 domain-containing protein [Marinobacterium jannaschii]
MKRIRRFGIDSQHRIAFYLNRLRERLWVKPLFFCILSIGVAFLAGLADHVAPGLKVPDISAASIETLLTIISSSMLVIAVFAAGAMLSAYTSASSIATPRSFSLVVADDVSQNALSTFLGAFIFSIVGLVALLNGFYQQAGRFLLFLLIIVVFAIVILSFVRWVDRIARLGRLGTSILKVEKATASAMKMRAAHPTMQAARGQGGSKGTPLQSGRVGYVQRIDMEKLQRLAEKGRIRIVVAALPGAFACSGKPLAYIETEAGADQVIDDESLCEAFEIGNDRTFDEDPRFGLVVLSEIASRALSPAVNDPGTAIDVIGSLVRLFTLWARTAPDSAVSDTYYDRIEIAELSIDDMFEDAFSAIARDGASMLEVAIRLQKGLYSLTQLGSQAMGQAAADQAALAEKYAEAALRLPEEVERLKAVSRRTVQRGLSGDKDGEAGE